MDASSLQTELETVYQWADDNNMLFNNKKFEVLRYGPGIRVVFTSSKNLTDILCNNKSKLPPNSHPGVYKLDCSCGQVTPYIGETKKRIITRTLEHKHDCFVGKWESSGACEHDNKCTGTFNWENPFTLAQESDYKARKVRESLEILCFNSGPNNESGLNKDYGKFVKTKSWTPFFDRFKKSKPKLKRWDNYWKNHSN